MIKSTPPVESEPVHTVETAVRSLVGCGPVDRIPRAYFRGLNEVIEASGASRDAVREALTSAFSNPSHVEMVLQRLREFPPLKPLDSGLIRQKREVHRIVGMDSIGL